MNLECVGDQTAESTWSVLVINLWSEYGAWERRLQSIVGLGLYLCKEVLVCSSMQQLRS